MPAHSARRRGLFCADWRIAAVTTRDVVIAQVILAVWGGVRAADYAAQVGAPTEMVSLIEEAMPMWAWVGLCWAVPFLVLTGIALRRHFMVWLGHAVGFVVYSSLTVGTFLTVIDGWPHPSKESHPGIYSPLWAAMLAALAVVPVLAAWAHRSRRRGVCKGRHIAATAVALAAVMTGMTLWPADGVRGVGPLITVTYLHFVFAMRMGPRPITPEVEAPTETVVEVRP